jgi:hypothetical protein
MFDVMKPAPMLGQVRLRMGQMFYGSTPMESFVTPNFGPAAPELQAPAVSNEYDIKCYHCNNPSEFKMLTKGQADAWSDPTGLNRGCQQVSERECNPYGSVEQQAFNPYGSVISYGGVQSVPFGGESYGSFSDVGGSGLTLMGRIPLAKGMGRTALR